MARFYISYSHKDRDLAILIASKLEELGNDILIDSESLPAGSDWRSGLRNSLKKSDVFLALITNNYVDSKSMNREIVAVRSYVSSFPNQKLFIPIVFDRIAIPTIVQDIQVIVSDRISTDEVVSRIEQSMDWFFGRKIAAEQKRDERKLKIERTSADYIDDSIQQLKTRVDTLESKANRWYIIGWGSLVSGVVVAVVLLILTINGSKGAAMGWPDFAFLSLKSLVIVALLLASAKYAFSLAKSYMIESLKNADRIHAISFGKFFLQAFGDNVDIKEVKQAAPKLLL